MAKSRDLIDALDLLTEQHAEIDKLFEALAGTRVNRRATFVELADKLAAHATIEEKLFYPVITSAKTSKLLHELVEEHLAIKRVIAGMLLLDLDADELDAKLSVLSDQVAHHAHEDEEAKLFPLVRKMMTASQLVALGDELIVLFEHLMAAEPHQQVPNETVEVAPLPTATDHVSVSQRRRREATEEPESRGSDRRAQPRRNESRS